ncbi:MAG: hypothetical protein EXS15_06965 [Phycisphaerales bacterium]|nr:hypothetical protein [Phycisphaerales bacterium]
MSAGESFTTAPTLRILPLMLARLAHISLLALTITVITSDGWSQSQVPGQINHSTRDEDTSANYPVEPTVADRGPLTMPGRGMPYELAQPQGFDRVYAVPGKPGMFYRASGGLFAVFDEGEYSSSKEVKLITRAPAGVVYYIGKPEWSMIRQSSVIAGGGIQAQEELRVEVEAERTAEATASERTGATKLGTSELNTARDLVVRTPIGESLPPVSGNDAGFGGGSARHGALSDTKPETVPAEYASQSADVAAETGQVPAGVDRSYMIGEGNDVRPRIVADFIYRSARLTILMNRAVHTSAPQ